MSQLDLVAGLGKQLPALRVVARGQRLTKTRKPAVRLESIECQL